LKLLPRQVPLLLPGIRFRGRSTRPRKQVVQPLQSICAQREIHHAHRAVELVQRPRTDDRRRHCWLMEQPRQGHIGRALTEFVAEPLEPFKIRAMLLHLLLEILIGAPADGRGSQGASQQTSSERTPGNEPDAIRHTGGNDFEFDRSLGPIVETLLRDDTEEMTAAGDFLPLRQLPPGKIAGAGIQYLALPHQLLHGLPDFVPGRLAVDMVHLVQIDAVGLKTPQTRFTGALDVQRREPRGIRPIPHAPVHLGRKHDLFPSTATLCKPTAENLFGPSLSELPPVDVRRVKKVHSQLQRTVHDRHAARFGGLRSKIHGAETEPAHLDARAPELYVLHGFALLSVRYRWSRPGPPRPA